MPEVFTNQFSFADGSVPTAEVFCQRFNAAFRRRFAMEKQERGHHGAPKAYATLTTAEMQVWIFWDPQCPEVQVQIDPPMERMILINAVLAALGGQPRHPDAWWKAQRRARTWRKFNTILIFDSFLVIAAAVIWKLHWWGLLLVVATILFSAWLYVVKLARSFRGQSAGRQAPNARIDNP